MATYRIRLKLPVWDDVTPRTDWYLLQKPNTQGTNVNIYSNEWGNPWEHFSEALSVVAAITTKNLSINDLTVYGKTSVVGTVYDVPYTAKNRSLRLCFTFEGGLFIVRFESYYCGGQ